MNKPKERELGFAPERILMIIIRSYSCGRIRGCFHYFPLPFSSQKNHDSINDYYENCWT